MILVETELEGFALSEAVTLNRPDSLIENVTIAPLSLIASELNQDI